MTNTTVSNGDQNPLRQEAKRGFLGLGVQVTMPGADYIFEGLLEHFIAGEASILLDYSFLKETKVRVAFNGFRFDGEVLFCERKGDRYDTHVVIPDVDERGVRRDPRYVVNINAKLYPPQGGSPVEATIIDISRDGLGFESVLQLNIGDTVAIESQSNLAFGMVRHCRQLSGHGPTISRAGLQVYDVLSKSETPTQPNQRWIGSILRRRKG